MDSGLLRTEAAGGGEETPQTHQCRPPQRSGLGIGCISQLPGAGLRQQRQWCRSLGPAGQFRKQGYWEISSRGARPPRRRARPGCASLAWRSWCGLCLDGPWSPSRCPHGGAGLHAVSSVVTAELCRNGTASAASSIVLPPFSARRGTHCVALKGWHSDLSLWPPLGPPGQGLRLDRQEV